MNAALAGRCRQIEQAQEHRRAVAEFRDRRRADQQARIDALLAELIHVLAQLPLEREAWPNQYSGPVAGSPPVWDWRDGGGTR